MWEVYVNLLELIILHYTYIIAQDAFSSIAYF